MKFLRNATLISFLILVGVIIFGYMRLMTHRGVDVPLVPDTSTSTPLGSATSTLAATSSETLLATDTTTTIDAPTETPTTTPAIITASDALATTTQDGVLVIDIGKTATWSGLSLMPIGIVEDSRCPAGAQCIQAGRVRVRVQASWGTNTQSTIFILGEPVILNGALITMTDVSPVRQQNQDIQLADYHFTFHFAPVTITYQNATSDLITVSLPAVGSITGRQFSITGTARGTWFFEGSFPVEVRGGNGGLLASGIATASSDWMTDNFVPFKADIIIPDTYSGTATIVLNRDNPSGLPANVGSLSFPVTISF